MITEFYYRWSKVRRHLRRLLSIAVVNSKDWNPNWEHLNSIKIHGYPYCSNKWKDKSCTHTCSNVTDRQRKTLKIIWHWSKLCCFVFLSLMGEYLENNIPACKKKCRSVIHIASSIEALRLLCRLKVFSVQSNVHFHYFANHV